MERNLIFVDAQFVCQASVLAFATELADKSFGTLPATGCTAHVSLNGEDHRDTFN